MEAETVDTSLENEGFADFAAAFDDSGYQTETEEAGETETVTTNQEGTQEPQDGGSGEDSTEDGETRSETEKSAEKDGKPGGESFTIKVNREEKTLTREEMTALAQKGFDYDRVRQQRDESRQELESVQKQLGDVQALKAELEGNQEILSMLGMISESSRVPLGELVESMYINMKKNQGMDENAAREALRADKLQKKLDSENVRREQETTSQDSQAERAQREVAEFRQQYPDVQITEALVDSLMADVQSGMSMVGAYQKAESARKDAEIADLKRQLEAEKQNRKNKESSPGSQSDSGGRRAKSDFEDFSSALFG